MKVTICYRSSDYLEYRFELEGADWETILEEEKALGESFNRAMEKIYPRKGLFDRFLDWLDRGTPKKIGD